MVCDTRETPSLPARRPSAGAVPPPHPPLSPGGGGEPLGSPPPRGRGEGEGDSRRGACLAVRTPPAALLPVISIAPGGCRRRRPRGLYPHPKPFWFNNSACFFLTPL